MTLKTDSILECEEFGSHGKPVVAVIGYNHDFAAYEQEYPDQVTPQDIADRGGKIGADEARRLFPELADYPYRR